MSDNAQRLDKWLWYARFAKTRSLATRIIAGGYIKVNRHRVVKASATVKCGDVLTATLGGRVFVIEVVAIAERRGPPAEAQSLFTVLSSPPQHAIATDDAADTAPQL